MPEATPAPAASQTPAPPAPSNEKEASPKPTSGDTAPASPETQTPEKKLERRAAIPAEFARREKELRLAKQRAQEAEKSWQLKEQAMSQKLAFLEQQAAIVKQVEELREKGDHLAAAKLAKLDLEKMNRAYLQDGKRNPEDIVTEKLAEYERKRAEADAKALEERAQRQQQEQLSLVEKQFKNMAVTPPKDNPTRWELAAKRSDLIQQAWDAVVAENGAGKTLTFEKALDLAEEAAQADLDALLKSSEKLKGKYTPVVKAEEASTAAEDPAVRNVVKARVGAKAVPKTAGTAPVVGSKLTPEQLRAQIVRKYAGRLNQ